MALVPRLSWLRRTVPLQWALLVTHGALLVLPLVLLVGTGALAHDQADQREKELAREAHLVAELIAGQLGDAIADPAAWGTAAPTLARAFEETGVGIRMIDATGQVRVSSGPRRGESLADRAEVRKALAGEVATTSRMGIPPAMTGPATGPDAERAWSFAAVPLHADGRVVGAVLVIHASREPWEVLGAFTQEFGWGAGVVTVAAVGMAVYAGWRVSRSLRALAAVADQIATGRGWQSTELDQIAVTRVAEVRAVAEAMRTMTSRLAERLRYNEEYASNVAHEFKTPLTTLRGTVDLLSEEAEMPPDQRRLFLENARTDLDRMHRMVQGLLELARIETPTARTDVLLDEVIGEVAGRYPGVVFTPGGGVVAGDAAQIELAALNLIENARIYGGPNVSVRTWTTDGAAGFDVEDDGPGISEANLPRVFDRFFTTGRDRSGTGLGLPLVRAIARAHRGEVDVESRPGWTRFRVRLG